MSRRGEIGLDELRRYTVARSLFAPTTLPKALARLGFVQADPIRAPARAQDLMLRHRVKGYRAGDLEHRYPKLDLEEGFFINYGFLSRGDYLRLHPRSSRRPWDPKTKRHAKEILAFIRERGVVHPRDVEAAFLHGKTVNYWGGSSNATTHLMQAMHYHGLLRVVRRDGGVRIYAADESATPAQSAAERRAHVDALIDLVVNKYAPLPAQSLGALVSRLRWANPRWLDELGPALNRAKERLACARVNGSDWYYPAVERPNSSRFAVSEQVRLLSPFDPVVWDRRRFEHLWGWAYRFEAYTPAAKRKLGYYAQPLLWRDQVIGWANARFEGNELVCELGFQGRRPRSAEFERELDAELTRMRAFLA